MSPFPGQEPPLRPTRDRWGGQRMNYQRKPRLGLVRLLPLPLVQILKPPKAFLHNGQCNGPIVRRDVGCGGTQL